MLKFVKRKNGFKSYQSDGFRIYYGKRGSVAGDNDSNPEEKILLLNGSMNVTIGDLKKNYTAPAEFKIPAKIYHKIESKDKTIFLLFD
jgi:hypothetical protein